MPLGSNPWGDFTRQNARIGAAAEVNRDPDFGRRQLEAASTGVVSPDEAEDRQTDKLDQTYIRMAERNAGIDAANVRAVAREARQQQVAQQREVKAQTLNQAREFRSQHIATTFDAKTGQAVPIKDDSGSMLRKAPGGRIMFNEKGDALEQDPASGKLTPAKGDVVFHGDRVLKRYSGGYAQDITDTDEGLKHLASRSRFEDRIAKSDEEASKARMALAGLKNEGKVMNLTVESARGDAGDATREHKTANDDYNHARDVLADPTKALPGEQPLKREEVIDLGKKVIEKKKILDAAAKKEADARRSQLEYNRRTLPQADKHILTIHQNTNIAKAQKKALLMLGKGRGDQPAEVEGPPDDREQGLAVTEEDKAAHQEITGGAPLPKSKSPLVSFTGEEEWGRKLDAKAKGADPIAQSADELKSHADSLQASKAKADEAAAKVQATIAPVQQKIEATQQANAQEVQTAPPGKIIQLQMPDGNSQPYTEKRAAELQKHIREMRETQAKAAPLQDAAESAAAEHNVSVDAYREKAKAHGKLLADANEKRLKSMEEVPAMKPHAEELRKLSAQREADLSDAEEMYSGPGAKAAVQAIEAHYDEQEKGVEAKIAQVHETAKAASEKLGKIKAGQELQQASTVADAAFEKADTADDMVARNEAQDQGKAAREALLKKHGLTEEEAAKLEKEQAAKHYTVSPDNKIVWEQGHEADALKAAVDDGQVDPAEAEKMRPQLEKLQDTYQKALKEAGSLSTLKAVAAGGGKGLAMLVGGAGGANVGQKLGTPGGVYGKMAGAAVGSVVGAITTGEVYDRVLPILAEYSDLAKSLEASKKLHPDAAGGAELASFLLAPEGLLKPSLFMKAATRAEAFTPAIAKSVSNIKETVSLAYQKGGMPLALKTAAKMTGAAAGGGAASGVAMEAMRPHIEDAMNKIQAQFDPLKTLKGSIGADDKAKPATMQSMGQSALEMGLFATILAGHHIQFRDYSTPEVEDIAVRGTLQEQLKGDFKGKKLAGLTEADFRKAIPEQNAADKAWQQYSELPQPMKERLDAPLDAGEQAVYKEISDQAAKLKKADKTGVLKSARQATYGGGAITTLGVEEGQRPAGEPPVAPPGGLPSSGPAAPEPPADGGGAPEVLPPEPSPAAQVGKVAAAQTEIADIPEDVDRVRAEALLAIGQGQAQSLSQDQLHSVGLDVQDGEIVPKKQGKGDLPPMAYVQHGQPIIKDVARQWLETQSPLAAQTITRDEAQTREWAKQQAEQVNKNDGTKKADSETKPADSETESAPDETPKPDSKTAEALKIAADHLEATGKKHNIGHLKAEAEALAAQPAAVDEPEASSEAAPEPEEGPGEVAPETPAETKPIGDQIRGAVEKHVADSDTAGVEPSKFAKHGKMVAKAVEKIAPAFKGVRIVDESIVPSAGLAVTSGVLEINPRRLVQVLSTAKSSNEAKARLDLALDEELDHRIFLDLYDTAPEFQKYADETWKEIPQELKALSADAYFNLPGARFNHPVIAMAEFYRQYNQNSKFRKITEQALRSKPGLLQKLKDLASRLLKELARIRDGATLPKIRERLDKIIAQIEAARQKLMGIESAGRDVSPADEAPASSRAEVKEDGGGASSKQKSELQKNADAIIAKGEAPTELGRKIRDIYSRGNPTPDEVAFLSDQFGFAKGTDPMQAMARFIVNSHVDPADVDVPGVEGDKPQAITAGNAETHSTSVATLLQDEVGPVYYVNSIQSLVPGKGGGKATLDALKAKAEKQGVPLMLDPQAFGEMTQPQLVAFYRRNRFEPVPGREDRGTMIWRPDTPAEQPQPKGKETAPHGQEETDDQEKAQADDKTSQGRVSLTPEEAAPKGAATYTKPTITAATYTDKQGVIHRAENHRDALKAGGAPDEPDRAAREGMPALGFEVTFPDGRTKIVDRAKAGKIAEKAGQLSGAAPAMLHSEDVFRREEKATEEAKPETPAREIPESLKERKAMLIDDLQQAIDSAPSLMSLIPDEMITAWEKGNKKYRGPRPLAEVYNNPGKYDVEAGDKEAFLAKHVGSALRTKGVDKVTIEVPGKGSMDIWNTKEALTKIQSKFAKVPASTLQAPNPEPRKLSFADKVKDAAALVKGDGRFGQKVFINRLWHAFVDKHPSDLPTFYGFKQALMEANRKGELNLSRADLVEAMNPEDVAASRATTMGEEFHFLNTEAVAPKPKPLTVESLRPIYDSQQKGSSTTMADVQGTFERWADQQRKQTGTSPIYRAGDETEKGVKAWSSWSEDKAAASKYLDNPGFGGKTLRTESVPLDKLKVLTVDTTTRPGMRKLAEALGLDPEKGDDWFDSGYRYPWEESAKVKKAIEDAGFEAVRYTDDFPEGAKTIVTTRDMPSVEPSRADFAAAMGQLYREGKIIVEPMEYPQNLTPKQRETLIPTRAAPGAFWKPAPETPKVSFREAGFASEKAARAAFDADELFKAAGTLEEYLAYRHCLGLTDL